MHNKKYRIEKIEKLKGYNPVYEALEGRVAYLAYLKEGERGWFLYESDDLFDPMPHRVHTSVIEDVQYTRGNQVIVTTQNTRYTFTVVE